MKIALVYINPWGGDGGLHPLANCFICSYTCYNVVYHGSQD